MPPFIMYVNFDDDETPPVDGPLDPETGCPFLFECIFEGMVKPTPCTSNTEEGQCVAKPSLIEKFDIGNTGFCLWYAVA